MKKVRGYNFSRPFMGERVPQHVQNIVIKDFCTKKKLNFLLSVTEYSMTNSFHILKELLDNLSGIHGVVAYSVFQMPYEDKIRRMIYKKILKKGKKIFFACEGLKISNTKDIKRIENIWLIKKASLNSLKTKDLKI